MDTAVPNPLSAFLEPNTVGDIAVAAFRGSERT